MPSCLLARLPACVAAACVCVCACVRLCLCVCVCAFVRFVWVRAGVRVCACGFVVVGSSCRALAVSWLLFCAVGSWAPRPFGRCLGLAGLALALWLGGLVGVAGPAGGLTLVPATPQKDAFGLEGLKVLFVPLRSDALPNG